MYRILVAGAGFTGSRIAHYFSSHNQKVWGIIRSAEKESSLQKINVNPIIADITRPETLVGIPPVNFVVIAVAPDARDEASYRKIYLEGVHNLLARVKHNSLPLLTVYLSSTGVYPKGSGEWVAENTEAKPDTERGKILLEAEQQVLNCGLPSVIFRLSGIYGYERNRINFIREGKWQPDAEDKYINMIHVDDIAAAIPVLFKSAEAGKVYLGVDDEPVLQSEFFGWISNQINVPLPHASKIEKVTGKRCKNTLLKSLGFKFQYPTFRDGYSSLLNSE